MRFSGKSIILIIAFIVLMPLQIRAEKKKLPEADVTIFANSSKIIIGEECSEMKASTITVGGRIYVPLRFTANAFGIDDEDIKWNEENQSVQINCSSYDEKLSSYIWVVDKDMYFVGGGGTAVKMFEEGVLYSTVIHNGRAYVPFRFLAYALMLDFSYNEVEKSITILSDKNK